MASNLFHPFVKAARAACANLPSPAPPLPSPAASPSTPLRAHASHLSTMGSRFHPRAPPSHQACLNTDVRRNMCVWACSVHPFHTRLREFHPLRSCARSRVQTPSFLPSPDSPSISRDRKQPNVCRNMTLDRDFFLILLFSRSLFHLLRY